MILLRSIIFFIGQVLWTCVLFFGIFLTIFFPTRFRLKFIATVWTQPMIFWLKLVCGITYEVQGRENIPKENGYIILSKHQSAWETLAFQLIFPSNIWVLKKELLLVPFFGWGLCLASPIAIRRSKGKEAMKQLLTQGKERLDNKLNVVIFPEGTRMPVGKHGKFKHGGSILAVETDTTIVPVAINAGEFWPKNSFLKYPGKITLRIGKPIEGNGDKNYLDLTKEVEQWIVSNTDDISTKKK